uniref:Dolichyl-P-Man Man n=1 Tax=Arundo donax TaxID=35708 RepID=A0A0A9E3K9_ARUDO
MLHQIHIQNKTTKRSTSYMLYALYSLEPSFFPLFCVVQFPFF